MKTRVVHCKREPYTMYIGRGRCPNTGRLSIWGNPFIIGRDGDRAEVITKHAEWLPTQADLMACIHELKGEVLGCWCKDRDDRACHGDTLAELADKT